MQSIIRYKYILLVSFCFILSCIKPADDVLVIIDPIKWSHHAIWIEDKMYFGIEDSINIKNGNELKLWWNELNENNQPIFGGEYIYSPKYSIDIDSAGYFKMQNDLLILYKKPIDSNSFEDTMAVYKYSIDQNQLIIRDTSVMPVLEYFYRKK